MTFDPDKLKQIIEGALLAAGKPLPLRRLEELFEESEPRPGKEEILAALEDIDAESGPRSFELVNVASGYRLQVKQDLAPWVSRLWEEKPQRYSRALLETLSLVAYRQPITRGEIEDIRGVAVSTNIMRTLLDRDWVRVVGHREVPGKPAMYATTRIFLDYFNLKSLDQLPSLAEIRDLENISAELDFDMPVASTPVLEVVSDQTGQEQAAGADQPSGAQQASEPEQASEVEQAGVPEQASEPEQGPGPAQELDDDPQSGEVVIEQLDEPTGSEQDVDELPSNVIELPTS